MKQVYLDQAASSFPKPDCVSERVYTFLKNSAVNVHRSAGALSYGVEEMLFDTRELLCDFFGAPDSRYVVFTKNITESLNCILQGLLHKGDHILCGPLEHNAVMRPLEMLLQKGVEYSVLPHLPDGTVCVEQIENAIMPNTKALVLCHASNVSGTVQPLQKVGEVCKKHNIFFIVDSAQTAGVLPIYMKNMHIDALAFTGHKSLCGPQGIGGYLLQKPIAQVLEPLLLGGTGSQSDLLTMPNTFPDRLEAGTLNLPGIAGLQSGLQWLQNMGLENIYMHEMRLTEAFIQGLQKLPVTIIGNSHLQNRMAVVSIICKNMAEVAATLMENYGISTRVGLHCAPCAHKTLGTFPEGTLRFSFSYFNTLEEIQYALHALEALL